MPFCENEADVAAADVLPNVTEPGPLTFVHSVVIGPPGKPSSDTMPDTETEWTGSVIV